MATIGPKKNEKSLDETHQRLLSTLRMPPTNARLA